MNRRIGWEIERTILVIIIVMGVLDFAGALSVFWGYVMDIIAWTSIAYLVYVISPTKLFFGEHHTGCDMTLVVAYAIMSTKDLIGNAIATLPQLIQNSHSYIKFTATQATSGIPFTVSTAELNGYSAAHLVPRSIEIATSIASHFSMTQQQLVVILTDGTRQVALTATPTTLNGTMLMFYNTLAQNSTLIQEISLFVGMILLLFASLYAAYKIPVRSPSILSVLKEEGKAGFSRVIWVFLLFVGFFVIIFNLLFEWMTITNDAPLLILALLIFTILFFIHHSSMSRDEIIEHLGNLGEEFYAKAMMLFTESSTILLGISGFLVLHLVTDVGNFIAPALLGWYKTIYVQSTAGNHATIYAMIIGSLSQNVVSNSMIIAVYILSTAGIVLLLTLPAVIWYKIFKIRSTKSHEHLPNWKAWHVGVILACIVTYVMIPVFSFSEIQGGDVVGVNLNSVPIGSDQMTLVQNTLLAAAIVIICCTLIGLISDHIRRILMLGPFLAAAIFFGIYVYRYFMSVFTYYATLLVQMIRSGTYELYAITPLLFVIFMFTILFFVTGFFSFLYEIWRE